MVVESLCASDTCLLRAEPFLLEFLSRKTERRTWRFPFFFFIEFSIPCKSQVRFSGEQDTLLHKLTGISCRVILPESEAQKNRGEGVAGGSVSGANRKRDVIVSVLGSARGEFCDRRFPVWTKDGSRPGKLRIFSPNVNRCWCLLRDVPNNRFIYRRRKRLPFSLGCFSDRLDASGHRFVRVCRGDCLRPAAEPARIRFPIDVIDAARMSPDILLSTGIDGGTMSLLLRNTPEKSVPLTELITFPVHCYCLALLSSAAGTRGPPGPQNGTSNPPGFETFP